jgi:hypothetical protein
MFHLPARTLQLSVLSGLGNLLRIPLNGCMPVKAVPLSAPENVCLTPFCSTPFADVIDVNTGDLANVF